jgi:cardiolipin synthase A/B
VSDVRKRAERLLREPVRRADLALSFDETAANTVDIQVEGRNFFPPMLRDIGEASSSVHINQFGFRPGAVGERFATALLAKAAEGVPVRLLVDRQGSDPDRSSRELYARLLAGGVEVRVVRATQLRAPPQPVAAGGSSRWNLSKLGHVDHRKLVVVDGRIGWVGGAGVEDHFDDGRFHDLFLRVTGPVASQLQLV